MKNRLDKELLRRGLVETRSQAESFIRMGKVLVSGRPVGKSGHMVLESDEISISIDERYVSRAGFKLASVADIFHLDFTDKVVLDVGSSTGGFTDYALQHGAHLVYAVDVGTDQLHPSLRADERVRSYEKTDIRDFTPDIAPGIVVIDVSFISLRDILPSIHRLVGVDCQIVAMVKPQFEAGRGQVSGGVIKNDRIRRDILKDFEAWVRQYFVIVDKADSDVAGSKGNRERFFYLHKV